MPLKIDGDDVEPALWEKISPYPRVEARSQEKAKKVVTPNPTEAEVLGSLREKMGRAPLRVRVGDVEMVGWVTSGSCASVRQS
jgi:hypothetical protein